MSLRFLPGAPAAARRAERLALQIRHLATIQRATPSHPTNLHGYVLRFGKSVKKPACKRRSNLVD